MKNNMDYEKKYKDALERARKLYEEGTITESLSHIFPELKESEDERIRKELIAHCRNTRCVTEEGAERIIKWISWLEKQEEQKPWSEGDERNLNAVLSFVDDEYLRRWLKDTIHKKYDKFTEWSEEDEKMCQETIDWFELKCFPFALENENPARKSITWLKSLKEKINL